MIRDRLKESIRPAARVIVAAVPLALVPRARSFAMAVVPVLGAAALSALSAVALHAQQMPGLDRPMGLAGQGLRPYWHVFAAYTIAIVLVIGWIWSIARRLRDVEERLGG